SLLLPKTWRSNHARRCSSVSIRFDWERTTSNHCAGVRLFISASLGTAVLVLLDIPTSYRRVGLGIALFLHRQPIALTPLPRLDPLQQQLQCRPVHLARTHLRPVRDKPACLETLRPDAKSGAVEIQDAHLHTAPVDEHIQRAIQRVAMQALSHQGLQTIERLPHVAGLTVQAHPDLALRKEHQLRTSCSRTPWPNSRRISNRERPDPSAPNSIKPDEGASRFFAFF